MFNSTISEKENYKIQTVDIQPGDTILLHLNDDVDLINCESIMDEMKKTFPNNNILVINEWVLKGMTIIRQAKPIGDSIDEIVLDESLENLYPDLFDKSLKNLYPDLFGPDSEMNALKLGETLW